MYRIGWDSQEGFVPAAEGVELDGVGAAVEGVVAPGGALPRSGAGMVVGEEHRGGEHLRPDVGEVSGAPGVVAARPPLDGRHDPAGDPAGVEAALGHARREEHRDGRSVPVGRLDDQKGRLVGRGAATGLVGGADAHGERAVGVERDEKGDQPKGVHRRASSGSGRSGVRSVTEAAHTVSTTR